MGSVIERHGLSRTATAEWLSVAAVLCATGWGSNQITPMLVYYTRSLDLSPGLVQAMFGVYALGLIPGLLVAGPLSDRVGRRLVTLPAAVLSLVATLALIGGGHSVGLLFAGRFLAGVSSGVVFSAGAAWFRELCVSPLGDADDRTVAKRTAIAMTLGFGGGPVAAGLIAQWLPAPDVLPYVPHLVFIVAALLAVLRVPETRPRGSAPSLALGVGISGPNLRRFGLLVVPVAPWVFGTISVAVAFLPDILHAGTTHDGIAFVAVVTGLALVTGVVVQSGARRLEAAAGRRDPALLLGLGLLVLGLVLAAATASMGALWMIVPTSVVMGGSYGMLMVAGLNETQRLAEPARMGQATAAFLALTYVGFGIPYLLAELPGVASYSVLLVGVLVVAVVCAVISLRALPGEP